MAKIPAYKRLYYTDFAADDQKVVEQLSYTINNSFGDLYGLVNNGINLRDNLAVSVNDVTVTVDAKGNPTSSATFSIVNSNTIDGLQVIKVTSNGNAPVYPTATPYITYGQNGSKISVVNVAGLPAGTSFTLRLVTFLT